MTFLPQPTQLQAIHHRLRNFQNTAMPGADDFGGNINTLTSNSRGIACHRNDVAQDIVFEGFEEKKGNEHAVVEGGIRSEARKGQLFESNVFQSPMVSSSCPH